MRVNERPDAPHVGLYNKHADAVAQASLQAALTGGRRRVRFDPINRWWNVTSAFPNTRVPGWDARAA